MSNDLEQQLRNALRAADPPEGFADRVVARVAAETKASAEIVGENVVRLHAKRAKPARRLLTGWFPVALAASAVLAVSLVQQWRAREELRGLEARRQLIEALRVTSDKLDSAYQAVNGDSSNGESKAARAKSSGV